MSRQVFINGKIFTADSENPYADAMITEDGVFRFAGRASDLPPDLLSEAEDLGGRRVIPGILDNHIHPVLLSAASKKIACLPPEIYSIEEIVQEVSKRRRANGPGVWIQGWGYDEGKLKEHRSPTRRDLDRGADDAPVVIVRTCVHIIAVNSEALRLAGIDRNTPDPAGGEIERDADGEPTGVLKENARFLVLDIIPSPDLSHSADLMVSLGNKLLSQGIVAVADSMSRYEPADTREIYLEAVRRGFRQRVAQYYDWEQVKRLSAGSALPEDEEARRNTKQQIFTAGLKLIADGSVSGRTAWLYEPYISDSSNHGMPVLTKYDLLDAAEYARACGLQIKIHAMGDRTIDLITDTLSPMAPWTENRPHIRIEHTAFPTKTAVEKAVRAGMAFTIQPVFLFSEIETYVTHIGKEALSRWYPARDILDAGARLAFSSDSPATSWADPSNPFIGMQFACTRISYDGTDCGAHNRVSIEEALALYTRESAYVMGIEDLGQIKEGYSAAFVVLDKDILEIPPSEISSVKAEKTYIDGECVYSLQD